MNRITRNEVDFSEIFYYAGKKFNIEWNRANDMFFNNSLDYKSHNEYSIGEPLEQIDDKPFEELTENEKGYYIINQFMIDNNVDSIWIDNT